MVAGLTNQMVARLDWSDCWLVARVRLLRHQCDDGRLHMEEVRVDLEEGEKVLGGLEEGGPEVDVEVVGNELKQLVDVQRASCVHGLSKELDELVRDDRVDPMLLRLPEGRRDLPLILLEEDNLLLDDKLLGISSQKVFELLDVLPGDMSHLQQSFQPLRTGRLLAIPLSPRHDLQNTQNNHD